MLAFAVYVALVVLGAIPALAFPVAYWLKVRPGRLPKGMVRETAEHLLIFSTLFALLYVRGAITLMTDAGRQAVFAESWGGGAFLLFLAAFAAFVAWQRVSMFRRGRKHARDGDVVSESTER